MHAASRDVGALTSALQRCLPRRTPSLEAEREARPGRLAERGFGRVVQLVTLHAVQGGREGAGRGGERAACALKAEGAAQ